jgi:hypothetical protein
MLKRIMTATTAYELAITKVWQENRVFPILRMSK